MREETPPVIERPKRRHLWTRLVDIALRATHVLAIGLLLGGEIFSIPEFHLLSLQRFVVLTGIALIISEILHRPHWITQIRGLMVLIHAGLLGLAIYAPALAVPCLVIALFIGMAGSHLPKNIRHWSYTLRRPEE